MPSPISLPCARPVFPQRYTSSDGRTGPVRAAGSGARRVAAAARELASRQWVHEVIWLDAAQEETAFTMRLGRIARPSTGAAAAGRRADPDLRTTCANAADCAPAPAAAPLPTIERSNEARRDMMKLYSRAGAAADRRRPSAAISPRFPISVASGQDRCTRSPRRICLRRLPTESARIREHRPAPAGAMPRRCRAIGGVVRGGPRHPRLRAHARTATSSSPKPPGPREGMRGPRRGLAARRRSRCSPPVFAAVRIAFYLRTEADPRFVGTPTPSCAFRSQSAI